MIDLTHALAMACRSDAGMVRAHNEDSVLCRPRNGLAMLADGMGGYNAGEVASSMTINLLAAELLPATETRSMHRLGEGGRLTAHLVLEAAIAHANAAVLESSLSQPQYDGMGTTLVAGLFYDNSLTIAHIGDSRAYRLRGGVLERLTRDHTLLQEQIDSGMITPDQARRSQNRSLLTRALGIDAAVEPELRDYDTLLGDTYLLCSDGLTDMLDDDVIAGALASHGEDLDQAANRLVQLANEAGGRDNVSAALIRVLREYPAPRGVAAWLREWLQP